MHGKIDSFANQFFRMPELKDFYSFEDLRNWEETGRDLDPPARLAVIGDPVEHSRSPQMMNPALAAAGKGAAYVRFQVSPQEVRESLNLLRENGFVGTNVTIPHKGDVFAAVDEATEIAQLTRSVNTVSFAGERTAGHNTDAPGLEQAIREQFSVDLSDLRVLVLGAGGGAGRAAAIQSAINRCERLVLVNRSFEKARALKKEIEPMFAGSERLLGPVDRLVAVPHENGCLDRELRDIDLVVNATPLGMKASDPLLVPSHLIEPHHLIYDMVYAPPQTRLMRDAIKAGARAANGLSMLLWQGVYAYEFWFNEEPPVETMRKGLENP